jgi:hypothetical protein
MRLKLHNLAVVLAVGVVGSIVACSNGDGEDVDSGDSDLDGTSLVCTAPPVARSYVLFDGSKLEANRANESVDANRARFKPFAVMADEYKRVLGLAPKSLAASAATFDDAPARWYAEPTPSGVTLSAVYAIGLDGCTALMANAAERAKAPTADTASAYCKDIMTKAWGTTPNDDELAACADLATNKLSGEPDARKKWAHVCATILSTSQFLTF